AGLSDAGPKAGLVAEITSEPPDVLGAARAVELNAARTLQAGKRGTRLGHPVVVPLPGFVQVFLLRQWQPKPRLRVNIRWHGTSPSRGETAHQSDCDRPVRPADSVHLSNMMGGAVRAHLR